MKYLFFLILVMSNSIYAQTYSTNMSEVTIKNFSCDSFTGFAEFNVVNKSSKQITIITIDIYDSSGDPINRANSFGFLSPNSGYRATAMLGNCNYSRLNFSVN